MPIRVKICGMTNEKDVHAARAAGADLLGFIFADSPRKVTVETARRLCANIEGTEGVAVVRGLSIDEVRRIREETGLRWVQFHDAAPPETVLAFAPFVLRVFDRFGEAERASLPRFAGAAFLLDLPKAGPPKHPEGRRGENSEADLAPDRAREGSGPGLDPDFAAEARKVGPVLIAGGLTPDNVAEAIRRFRPDGVDACSALEASPGRKDPAKVRAFIAAVREAERQTPPMTAS